MAAAMALQHPAEWTAAICEMRCNTSSGTTAGALPHNSSWLMLLAPLACKNETGLACSCISGAKQGVRESREVCHTRVSDSRSNFSPGVGGDRGSAAEEHGDKGDAHGNHRTSAGSVPRLNSHTLVLTQLLRSLIHPA